MTKRKAVTFEEIAPPKGFKQEPRSSGVFCLWDDV